MFTQEKVDHILALFRQLTTLTKDQLPLEERDKRLANVGRLSRGTLFSYFHEKHLEEAAELFAVLYSAESFPCFVELAAQARDIVNEGIFAYALSVAVAHRDDCRGLILPPIQEVFPDRFIPAETINLATKEAKKHPNDDIIVDMAQTGNIRDQEHKLAYFREDIEINAHHWHWHVIYPTYWDDAFTGKKKDRKGELFHYSHQQMCARYDCERLSNGLYRTIPLNNFKEKFEGYAPHLTSLISGLHYTSRPEGFSVSDLRDVDVQDVKRWGERILKAIDMRHIYASDGSKIPLNDTNGANILGAIAEGSFSSPNKAFYGSFIYWAHVMMARLHDPDGRFKENPGVMSDLSTCLRDPIFYRWHRFVDNVFQRYKATLKSYSKEELSFDGIHLTKVEMNGGSNNVVTTFMKKKLLDISHGIDFGSGRSVKVRYDCLDHENYRILCYVMNNTGEMKPATFRIFLGPKYDELGNRFLLDEQRRLMIELDKFHKELKPGLNIIGRSDFDSSVTLKHYYTFNELKSEAKVFSSSDTSEYCSCGWPKHMILPMGTEEGMKFEVFVMCTDYTEDNPEGDEEQIICRDAVSYCGAMNQKYPDKKTMGFPFDRPIIARTAAEFLTDNMKFADVTIRHLGL